MFVGTGLEDRRDERIEAPEYSALYFSFSVKLLIMMFVY